MMGPVPFNSLSAFIGMAVSAIAVFNPASVSATNTPPTSTVELATAVHDVNKLCSTSSPFLRNNVEQILQSKQSTLSFRAINSQDIGCYYALSKYWDLLFTTVDRVEFEHVWGVVGKSNFLPMPNDSRGVQFIETFMNAITSNASNVKHVNLKIDHIRSQDVIFSVLLDKLKDYEKLESFSLTDVVANDFQQYASPSSSAPSLSSQIESRIDVQHSTDTILSAAANLIASSKSLRALELHLGSCPSQKVADLLAKGFETSSSSLRSLVVDWSHVVTYTFGPDYIQQCKAAMKPIIASIGTLGKSLEKLHLLDFHPLPRNSDPTWYMKTENTIRPKQYSVQSSMLSGAYALGCMESLRDFRVVYWYFKSEDMNQFIECLPKRSKPLLSIGMRPSEGWRRQSPEFRETFWKPFENQIFSNAMTQLLVSLIRSSETTKGRLIALDIGLPSSFQTKEESIHVLVNTLISQNAVRLRELRLSFVDGIGQSERFPFAFYFDKIMRHLEITPMNQLRHFELHGHMYTYQFLMQLDSALSRMQNLSSFVLGDANTLFPDHVTTIAPVKSMTVELSVIQVNEEYEIWAKDSELIRVVASHPNILRWAWKKQPELVGGLKVKEVLKSEWKSRGAWEVFNGMRSVDEIGH